MLVRSKEITEIDFANVTSIGDYAFQGHERLVQFNDDNKIQYLGGYTFDGCVSLIKAIFPEIINIFDGESAAYTFGKNTSLVKLELGENYIGSLYAYLITNAPNLRQVIIRTEDAESIDGIGNISTGLIIDGNNNFRFYLSPSVADAV